MTNVRIPLARFTSGRLPSVCTVSGIPAAEVFALHAVDASGARTVAGAVPLHGDVARNLRTARGAVVAAVLLTLLIGVAGAIAASAAVVAGALLCGIIAAAIHRWTLTQAPVAVDHGDEVELRNVHPAFVKALTAPPSACSGCPSAGSCSPAEMESCDGTHHSPAEAAGS